jgi:hypothetical protein
MLKIEIIGTNDSRQKILVRRVQEAIETLDIEAAILEISNWEDILQYNIIKTPALVIRKQVLSQGFLPQVEDISKLITAFIPESGKKEKSYTARIQPDFI